MADLLKTGSTWLNGQRHENMAATVAYTRDAVPVNISATVGSTEFVRDEADGLMESYEMRDYLIRASDLLAGFPTNGLPTSGDTITDDGYIYEVMAADGAPCYRWSDRHHTVLRIHTKLTAES